MQHIYFDDDDGGDLVGEQEMEDGEYGHHCGGLNGGNGPLHQMDGNVESAGKSIPSHAQAIELAVSVSLQGPSQSVRIGLIQRIRFCAFRFWITGVTSLVSLTR